MDPKMTRLFENTNFMTKTAKPLRFTAGTNLAVRTKAILTGDGAAAQNTCTFTKTALPGKSAPGRGAGKKRNKKRSEEHTSELQSRQYLVCRLLLEKKKNKKNRDDVHNTDINHKLNRTNGELNGP